MTGNQMRVLKYLARQEIFHTAPEINEALGMRKGLARDCIHGLRKLGLVEARGVGPRNADTWAITDDGLVEIELQD